MQNLKFGELKDLCISFRLNIVESKNSIQKSSNGIRFIFC